MTKFYLLRRGETEWNHDHNRYCGRTDIELSSNGEKQALAAASSLRSFSFDAIYCSPLKRAFDTANIVKEYHPQDIVTDTRLIEIDFGVWEGKKRDQIEEDHQLAWRQWLEDPTSIKAGETGETALTVYERAFHFFEEKTQQYPNGNVLVVAHNTVNRLFITGSLHQSFNQYRSIKQHNTGISIIDVNTGGEVEVVQLNSVMHLTQ
jgi:uncharacterized phosphatase